MSTKAKAKDGDVTSGKAEHGSMFYVAVAACVPTAVNPRVFDPDAPSFLELVDSVKGAGVTTPIDVRNHPVQDGKYEVLAGTRRYHAAKAAGLKHIIAIFHEGLSDGDAFLRTFLENFSREDLTPFEQGRAVVMLLERFGNDLDKVAATMGQSRHWVRTRSRLQDLTPEWQAALADPNRPNDDNLKWMTISDIHTIAKYPSDVQDDVLKGSRNWRFQGDGRKDLAKWMDFNYMHRLHVAPWDIAEDDVAGKVACSLCGSRSGAEPDLWSATSEVTTKDDRCFDTTCWSEKLMVALNAILVTLKEKHDDLVLISNDVDANANQKDAVKDALGNEVLSSWNWSAAKKADKGAVPAMVVMGPGLGKIKWIDGHSRGIDQATTSSAPSGKASGPTPLKVRRERLNRRRWITVLKRVDETLDKQVKPPADDVLYPMATFWGVQPPTECKHGSFEDYDKFVREISDVRLFKRHMWTAMKPQLHAMMAIAGAHTDVDEKMSFAEGLWKILDEIKGKLKGVDFEALKATAVAKIPDPKSWSSLNEDGTPKKKKVKK